MVLLQAVSISGKPLGDRFMQNKLYIANVPYDTTEEALRRHFAICGGVLQVDLPDETQRGKMRGLACVTMTSPSFANAALTQLDGVSFAGRVLRVTETPPPAASAPKPAVTIVQQFRERSNMAYDLDCKGLPLVVRIFPEEESRCWRIEARANDALDARVVSASAPTRAAALAEVIRAWNENAAVTDGRALDGDALARALQSVRAV
jgi:RNA recognition motif-containing protein